MPKGPKLKNEVFQVISTEVAKNPRGKRHEIVAQIERELDRRGSRRKPSRNTLLKLISTYRHHSPLSLDVPWSIGSLPQNPIVGEGLAVVLQAYVLNDLWKLPSTSHSKRMERTLSIRESLWISRIYPLFIDTSRNGGSTSGDWKKMIKWAKIYSSKEQAWEAAKKKTHFYTPDHDKKLMKAIGIELEPKRLNTSRLPFPIGGKKNGKDG